MSFIEFDIFKYHITAKSKVDYTRFVLQTIEENIGFQIPIKEHSTKDFKFLLELVNLHPEKNYKVENKIIKDFKIDRNKLNKKAIELYIIFNDATETTISWRYCCEKRKTPNKQFFYSALRCSVESQIFDFKKKNRNCKCWNCNIDLYDYDFHADHYNRFIHLVSDFIDEFNIKIPNSYDKEPIAQRKIFKAKDYEISKQFYDYHEKYAILKPSCSNCNLRRSKK
tara:strand:+ start:6011 stop:6685 length:675 start_codon:yes stop_codon:yes gene_type:complete